MEGDSLGRSLWDSVCNMGRMLIEIAYPRLCPICRRRLSWAVFHLCPSCALALRRYNPLLDRGQERLYGTPLFRNLYSLYAYEHGNRVQRLVLSFKYEQFPNIAEYAALEAVTRLKITQRQYDLIIAIPTTVRGYNEKGYNPAYLLAQALGKHLNANSTDTFLLRNNKSQSQKTLDKRSRHQNAKRLFSANPNYDYSPSLHRVLLVDDVLTTGATLVNACDTLEALGIKEVDVFTLSVAI